MDFKSTELDLIYQCFFYEEIESSNTFRELDVKVAIVGIYVSHGVEYFVVGVKVLASSFHHHAFYKIILVRLEA